MKTIDDPAEGTAAPLLASADVGYVHVRCPGCGADDSHRHFRLQVSDLVSCNRCGLSYVDPRVATAQLARKLQAWAEQDVVDAERLRIAFDPATFDYYARFLARVEQHRTLPGRSLLDIGCSTGALLSVARDAGWDVRGVEIGQASAAYARDRLGLDVHCGSLIGFPAPRASFDAIAMVEVIEHLERPAEALAAARDLLRPGGLLLVTTPNVDSLYRRLFGPRWWVINCEDEHIVLFNPASLAALLEATGFDVVDRHVRGLDLVGMMRELRTRIGLGPRPGFGAPATAAGGYYEGRSAKTKVKRMLDALGMLRAARAMLRFVDASFSWRASPTYAWGEQLVVVARRKPPAGGESAVRAA